MIAAAAAGVSSPTQHGALGQHAAGPPASVTDGWTRWSPFLVSGQPKHGPTGSPASLPYLYRQLLSVHLPPPTPLSFSDRVRGTGRSNDFVLAHAQGCVRGTKISWRDYNCLIRYCRADCERSGGCNWCVTRRMPTVMR